MKIFRYLAILLSGLFLCTACQKEFSLLSDGDQAKGSLKDTLGSCLPVAVKGDYILDSALTDSNFVIVQVNFTAPGSYDISTDTANGFSFHAAGLAQNIGPQTIILQATGKPALPQQTNFSIAFDSSVCSFSVSVIETLSPDSAWQFSTGGNFYRGFIDTALTYIDTSVGNTPILSFYGHSYAGEDTLFQIDVLLTGNTIEPGVYNTDSANADFFLFNEDASIATYFTAYAGIIPRVNIQIAITSYNRQTRIVTGTFSGTAITASGQMVVVSGGKIYAKVD